MRARQAQRMNDLKGRIKANTTSQEGDSPAEDVAGLIDAYLATSREHMGLMVQIANTNAKTVVDETGASLLDLLQQREWMIRERNLYGSTADGANPGQSLFRFARNEIKQVSNVDVPDLRRKEEELTERIRVLDAEIQKLNWATELV